MSDFLLESAAARALIRTIGLPLPVPEPLERASGPFEERPLTGREVLIGVARGTAPMPSIIQTIAAAGAEPRVDRGGAGKVLALVFDATEIERVAELSALYEFFHRSIERLDRSGRVVVVGRPPEAAGDAESAATRRALEGFVRSLAKEIGRRGATANIILVDEDAEGRLAAVLRFLLSKRSAFVSAQPFHVTTRARSGLASSWIRPLEGKVALVTGAARGIGAATAKRLAGEGAHVVGLDRPSDASPLSEVAREIDGSFLLADLGDAIAAKTIAAELRGRHHGVDIVVHNAGITRDKTLARMDPPLWEETVDVNLGAVIRVTRALLEGVLRDEGRIVCLSSIAAIAGNVGQTNYSASKAGLIGFAEHQARALAGRGITVNAVAPGFIETRMTAAVPFFVREVGRRLSALGQGGLPEDVAEVITFLATPSAVGLTGSVVRTCGGAFIGA